MVLNLTAYTTLLIFTKDSQVQNVRHKGEINYINKQKHSFSLFL